MHSHAIGRKQPAVSGGDFWPATAGEFETVTLIPKHQTHWPLLLGCVAYRNTIDQLYGSIRSYEFF